MTESTSEVLESKKKHSPADGGHHGHEHGDASGDDHHGHGEYPFLQHHFDTPQQQFDAGKMGIWLFLVTEVLFFAGLFCAYTVYRAQHPEIFVWAHYYLDTTLGAVNTVVLLGSSLTAAWAVRCAQLKQKQGLIINIVITIACAFTFMCVKYVEYSHKFHDGLTWPGRAENPLFGVRFAPKEEVWELEHFKEKHPQAAALAEKLRERSKHAHAEATTAPVQGAGAVGAAGADPTQARIPEPAVSAAPAEAASAGPVAGNEAPAAGSAKPPEPAPAAAAGSAAPSEAPAAAASGAAPAAGSAEAAATATEKSAQAAGEEPIKITEEAAWPLRQAGVLSSSGELLEHPRNAHQFFSIYFFMTGLHGVHVLAGIIVWIWMLTKAMKGVFGENYFGPIDYAALYWHIVDLVWIYLFPLLYLIH